MTLSDLVLGLRLRSELSQRAFAKAIGVSESCVQKWERGGEDPQRGYDPRGEQLQQMARLVGVTISTSGRGWEMSQATGHRRATRSPAAR